MNLLPSIIYVNISVLLFSVIAVIGSISNIDPMVIVFGRTLFAAFGLSVFLQRCHVLSDTKKSFKEQSLLGFSGLILCCHWVFFFMSITTGSVAIALLTFACFPFFVTCINLACRTTQLSLMDIACSVSITIGAYIMIGDLSFTEITPWIYGFVSSLLFAILTLINKRIVYHFNPINISFVQNTISCTLLSFFVYGDLGNLKLSQWGLLIFFGLVCTAFAHTLLILSLQKLSAFQASLFVNMEPIYGILLATVFLGEEMKSNELIGAVFILIAIGLGLIPLTRYNKFSPLNG